MPSDTDRWDVIEEDLSFLISQGVRNGETLAARLGFTNVATFERYCYRREIPLLHKKSPFLQEKPMAVTKRDVHQNESAYVNPPHERQLAVSCVQRHFGNEHPSVLEVLDMLGLASEQQLVTG